MDASTLECETIDKHVFIFIATEECIVTDNSLSMVGKQGNS